jgi:pimeloyl-ACP methyl ester carboxylesterase
LVEKDVVVDGTRIAVRESSGRGPAIMMIHGNSTSSVLFRQQLEGALGTEFRVIALDLPGHGNSARAADPERTYNLPGLAHVVAAVARELDAEDEFFVGWSLGGHALLEAVALLPRARGFCIVGTPPARRPPNFDEIFLPHPMGRLLFQEALSEAERREWIGSYFGSNEPVPDELVTELGRSDPKFRQYLGATISAVHYSDEAAIVAAMTQPLAVFHGAEDALINLSYIESLRMPSLWRGAVQVIDRAGHAPQWSTPRAFDALVGDFVRSAL